MIAGTIEIQMLANTARLQTDMYKAKRTVSGAMSSIDSAIGTTMKMFGALGGALSAGALLSMTRTAIDAADKLNDLSKSTSLSIETLSGLKLAATQSGSDLDGTAKAINKLSKEIGENAKKYAEIGVTSKDPLEAFKQLSDIFVKIEDPQKRAAFGAAALGKSWESAAPLLSEGGVKIQEMIDKGIKLSGVTEENAKAADAFNDSMAELSMVIQDGFLMAASEMIPLMEAALSPMSSVTDQAIDMDVAFDPLTETLRVLIILGGNIAYIFKQIGVEIGGIAAQAARVSQGDFSGAWGIHEAMVADGEKALKSFNEWEKTVLEAGKRKKEAIADLEKPANVMTGGDNKAVDKFIGGGKAAKIVKVQERDLSGFMRANELAMGAVFADEQIAKEEETEKKALQIFLDRISREEQFAFEYEERKASFMIESAAQAQQQIADEEARRQGDRYAKLTEESGTRLGVLQAQAEAEIAIAKAMRDAEIINEEEFQKAKSKIIVDAAGGTKTEIEGIAFALKNFENMTAIDRTKTGLAAGVALTNGLATQSKKAFEVNKSMKISQAIMNTYEAATGAFSAMASIPYVGPALGALAAANAIAVGMAQVKAIKSTSFGGGGSVSASIGGGGVPSMSGPTAPTNLSPGQGVGVAAQETRTININVTGEDTYQTVLRLAPALNEAASNGVVFNVARA